MLDLGILYPCLWLMECLVSETQRLTDLITNLKDKSIRHIEWPDQLKANPQRLFLTTNIVICHFWLWLRDFDTMKSLSTSFTCTTDLHNLYVRYSTKFYCTLRKIVIKKAVEKPKANTDLSSQLLMLSYTVKSLGISDPRTLLYWGLKSKYSRCLTLSLHESRG